MTQSVELGAAASVTAVSAPLKASAAVDGEFAAVLSSTAAVSGNTDLDAIFEKASATYGVSVTLLKAIAKTESGFNPSATSSCGAMGVMQLMPQTAAYLGVTDAYDPEQNIMGGAKLISQLLSKYNGDLSLALAAYNAGSGNVDKYGGIPPFTETQTYVARVIEYMGGDLTVPPYSRTSSGAGIAPYTIAESSSSDLSGAFESIIMTKFMEMMMDSAKDDDENRHKIPL